jgi:hypothetical protein
MSSPPHHSTYIISLSFGTFGHILFWHFSLFRHINRLYLVIHILIIYLSFVLVQFQLYIRVSFVLFRHLGPLHVEGCRKWSYVFRNKWSNSHMINPEISRFSFLSLTHSHHVHVIETEKNRPKRPSTGAETCAFD